MARIPRHRAAAAAKPETQLEPLKVVMLHDTADRGRRALGLLERLQGGLDRRAAMEVEAWAFEGLQLSRLSVLLHEVADRAQMVLVAADARQELPGPVRDWLTGWAGLPEESPRALVALLEDPPERRAAERPAWSELERLSTQSGVDFFAHVSPAPAAETSPFHGSPDDPRGWGINE